MSAQIPGTLSLILLLLLPRLASAQQVSNEALVDSVLIFVPKIIAIAEQGVDKIQDLRTTAVTTSFMVTDTNATTHWTTYFNSNSNFPGAAETRIIENLEYLSKKREVLWSVILSCEYYKNQLGDGRSSALFNTLDSVLGKRFPKATQLHDAMKNHAGTTDHIYSKLILPGHYLIGLEAWHSKTGMRNLVRLYVTTAS